jgi:XTP/dITP diphosphohydrolase
VTLVLATRNRGKLREIAELLKGLPVAVRSLAEFPKVPALEEVGGTFVENASLKALSAAQATGCLALADDSGLEVEALGGRPGVLSARYAGEGADYPTMCRKVLGELAGVPKERRRARFVCAVAAAQPTGILWTLEATCAGYIAQEMRGNEGFGYDPIFFYPPLRRTFAELTPAEKNAVSHRGRAFRRARARLAREFARRGRPRGGGRRERA